MLQGWPLIRFVLESSTKKPPGFCREIGRFFSKSWAIAPNSTPKIQYLKALIFRRRRAHGPTRLIQEEILRRIILINAINLRTTF